MSRFKKVIEENKRAALPQKKERTNYTVPTYTVDGRISHHGKKGILKKLKLYGAITVIVLAFTYVPQLFIKDGTVVQTEINANLEHMNHTLNTTAMHNNGTMDYDNDGLSNEDEIKNKTDMWNVDSDGDGVSDGQEVNEGTNPRKHDNTLVNTIKDKDAREGKEVSDPYKIGNVVLWADNYESKAMGGVIETTAGYRFCGFEGYAQFPDYENIYVYELKNGIRKKIEMEPDEQAWKIKGDMEVEVYHEPLSEVVCFGLFGNKYYTEGNIVTKAFSTLLPDKGFISAVLMTSMDTDPDTRETVSTQVKNISYDETDYARLTHNDNNMGDLVFVRSAIQDGACILASFYSADTGEAIGIIYGYTHEGDLLVADPETMEHAGVVSITEKAKMLMMDNGEIVSYSYYDYSGFGFNSENGDKISFFAASKNSDSYNSHFGEYETGLNYGETEIPETSTEKINIDYE